jgi:hypothetical protein
MRRPPENKSVMVAERCDCAKCRTQRALATLGLEGRPLTPAEYHAVQAEAGLLPEQPAPPPGPRPEVEAAQATFDRADAEWKSAVGAFQAAVLASRNAPMLWTADGRPVAPQIDTDKI